MTPEIETMKTHDEETQGNTPGSKRVYDYDLIEELSAKHPHDNIRIAAEYTRIRGKDIQPNRVSNILHALRKRSERDRDARQTRVGKRPAPLRGATLPPPVFEVDSHPAPVPTTEVPRAPEIKAMEIIHATMARLAPEDRTYVAQWFARRFPVED